jgi:hypothetical protein
LQNKFVGRKWKGNEDELEKEMEEDEGGNGKEMKKRDELADNQKE